MNQPAIYSELIDLLAETTDRERLANFRLSPAQQRRLDALLEKNRKANLSVGNTSAVGSWLQIRKCKHDWRS